MRAVYVKAFGPADALEVREVPDAIRAPNEALIAVEAAAVNYSDLLQRSGLYLGGPTPPFAAGTEAAGVVLEAPAGSTLEPGQRVMLLGAPGAQAERVAVAPERCVPAPAELSAPDAAAFLVPFLTAFHCLDTMAHARAGEVALIHAAAGGFGEAAVQVARALGLRVLAVASSEEKRAHALTLGAEAACGYDEVRRVAADVTQRAGVDVVLDGVGGEAFTEAVRCLAPFGRVVIVGASSGRVQRVDATRLVFRSQSAMGFHLARVLERPEALHASVLCLRRWLQEGTITSRARHRFALDEVATAHRTLEDRSRIGRVVLTT